MRIAVVTSDGLEHRYVLKRLLASLGPQIVQVVIERWPPRKANIATAAKLFRRYGPLSVAERAGTQLVRKLLRHTQRAEAANARVLGLPPELPQGLECVETPSANKPECVALLRELAPDYILVYGTAIVRQPLIDCAGIATLNMHTGISPFYRGSDSEFWPLYEGKPQMVGATVHACTATVDGGAVFATRRATLHADDDVFTAFARSVRAGADLYAEVVSRLASGEKITPTPQEFAAGREYRFRDRTLVHDLRMEFRTLTGSLSQMIAMSTCATVPRSDAQ